MMTADGTRSRRGVHADRRRSSVGQQHIDHGRNAPMNPVTSADGTVIPYETRGDGVPVVLIGGAFNDRHSPPSGIALGDALGPDSSRTSVSSSRVTSAGVDEPAR